MAKLQLYAQPYDMDAKGFYFSDSDDFEKKMLNNENKYGELVEEYMFQFIDGNEIESSVFEALRDGDYIDLYDYEDALERLEDEESAAKFTYLVGENVLSAEDALDKLDDFRWYEGSLKDYVYNLLDDIGIENVNNPDYYFDEERYGRDIRIDGSHTNHLYEDLEYDGTLTDDEKEDLQDQIDELEKMSDRQIGEYYLDAIGGVGELSKRDREAYFDYDAFARDMEMNGDVTVWRSSDGTEYVIESYQLNPRRKRKAAKRRNTTRRRTSRRHNPRRR